MIKIYNRFNDELINEFDVEKLRDANLRGANLRGAALRGANLRDANLRGANLSGAALRGANLSGADLRCANLRDADLRGANLSGADLRGADLRDANLRCANLCCALIVIYGLEWQVYITKNHIRIGCQAHDLEEWESFTDGDILNMHSDAQEFWKGNKDMIINLCKRLSEDKK